MKSKRCRSIGKQRGRSSSERSSVRSRRSSEESDSPSVGWRIPEEDAELARRWLGLTPFHRTTRRNQRSDKILSASLDEKELAHFCDSEQQDPSCISEKARNRDCKTRKPTAERVNAAEFQPTFQTLPSEMQEGPSNDSKSSEPSNCQKSCSVEQEKDDSPGESTNAFNRGLNEGPLPELDATDSTAFSSEPTNLVSIKDSFSITAAEMPFQCFATDSMPKHKVLTGAVVWSKETDINIIEQERHAPLPTIDCVSSVLSCATAEKRRKR